jgi:hypothetical protein
VPVRVGNPRDKAKVEVAVQVMEPWILARLRHRRLFSLGELNAAIRELTDALNARTMRGIGSSRAALFAAIERPALLSPAIACPANATSLTPTNPRWRISLLNLSCPKTPC